MRYEQSLRWCGTLAEDRSRFTSMFEALSIRVLLPAPVCRQAVSYCALLDQALQIMERAVERHLARRQIEALRYVRLDQKSSLMVKAAAVYCAIRSLTES